MDYIANTAIMGVRLNVKPGAIVSDKKLNLGKKSLENYIKLGYLTPVKKGRGAARSKATDPNAETAEQA